MSPKIEKRRTFIINFVYLAILFGIFAFFLKYAFWPLFPLIFGGFLAVVLQNPVNRIVAKTKIPKGIASVIMVIGVLLMIILIMAFLGVQLINEVREFLSVIVLKLEDYAWIESQVYGFLDGLPGVVRDMLAPTVNTLLQDIETAMMNDSSTGLYKLGVSSMEFDVASILTSSASGVMSAASVTMNVMIAFIICIVSACFMCTEYDIISKFIRETVPGGENNIVSATKRVLMTSVWKLFKAYFIICCITAFEMFTLLNICKAIGIYDSEYILAISILSALFDILPVVGIGTIASVWGIFALIKGDYIFCFALLVIYIIITVIRQIIEPKLIASEMSVPASVTIVAMYSGLKAFGVLGLFSFTIGVYCLKVLNMKGVIDLFGRREKAAREAAEAALKSQEDAPQGDCLITTPVANE